jgi:hypothetical protein
MSSFLPLFSLFQSAQCAPNTLFCSCTQAIMTDSHKSLFFFKAGYSGGAGGGYDDRGGGGGGYAGGGYGGGGERY